jgi:predicted nucleotidyltransferase
MIALSARDRAILVAILDRRVPGVPRRVFGSRAGGAAKPFSDLDLLLLTDSPLPADLRGALREDLSESDLPFRVDLVDAAACSPAFLAAVRPLSLALD